MCFIALLDFPNLVVSCTHETNGMRCMLHENRRLVGFRFEELRVRNNSSVSVLLPKLSGRVHTLPLHRPISPLRLHTLAYAGHDARPRYFELHHMTQAFLHRTYVISRSGLALHVSVLSKSVSCFDNQTFFTSDNALFLRLIQLCSCRMITADSD